MSEFTLKTPQLRYVSGLLQDYANKYGVPTTDDAISFEQRTAPDQVRRHGHVFGDSTDKVKAIGLGREFVVGEIAKTIPLLLGRLALYDRGHLGSREGVRLDEIQWLRLVNIPMDDPRVYDIVAIVGAHKTPHDEVLLDHDGHLMLDDTGNVARRPVPYTLHPFAGSDYNIRVSLTEPANLRIPMTIIDFSLPEKEYVSRSQR